MDTDKLDSILADHKAWLADRGGNRADLSGADLRGAYLSGAYLRGADLRGAYLRGADLRGADLSGADLRFAKNILTVGPIGSRDDLTYFVGGDEIMVKCGCYWGSIDEFSTRVTETHGDNRHARAYLAAIELARIILEA